MPRRDPKQDILDAVDQAIDPSNMSPEDALEFLQDLGGDLDMKIEGLRSDIRRAARK